MQTFQSFGQWLWLLLNSNFGTALLGAFFGAVAGAWAAQQIGKRDARRKRLSDELSNSNRAIMLTFGVTNAYVCLKKQHTAAMQEEYATECLKLQAIKSASQVGAIFRFTANLKTLQLPSTQIAALADVVLAGVRTTNRPLQVLNHLVSSIDGVAASIELRNALAMEMKGRPQAEIIPLYFGLSDSNGNSDTRYGDNLESLAAQTDDCIYFSMALARLLDRHARRLVLTLGNDPTDIPMADFSTANEFLPDVADYEGHETTIKAWLDEPIEPLKA